MSIYFWCPKCPEDGSTYCVGEHEEESERFVNQHLREHAEGVAHEMKPTEMEFRVGGEPSAT